jgi:hypothetical protein
MKERNCRGDTSLMQYILRILQAGILFLRAHRSAGGSGKRSLPMICPSAIGKAFGLAAATQQYRGEQPGTRSQALL